MDAIRHKKEGLYWGGGQGKTPVTTACPEAGIFSVHTTVEPPVCELSCNLNLAITEKSLYSYILLLSYKADRTVLFWSTPTVTLANSSVHQIRGSIQYGARW